MGNLHVIGSLPHPSKNIFLFQMVKKNEKEICVEKWNLNGFPIKTMLNTKLQTCETFRKV